MNNNMWRKIKQWQNYQKCRWKARFFFFFYIFYLV